MAIRTITFIRAGDGGSKREERNNDEHKHDGTKDGSGGATLSTHTQTHKHIIDYTCIHIYIHIYICVIYIRETCFLYSPTPPKKHILMSRLTFLPNGTDNVHL